MMKHHDEWARRPRGGRWSWATGTAGVVAIGALVLGHAWGTAGDPSLAGDVEVFDGVHVASHRSGSSTPGQGQNPNPGNNQQAPPEQTPANPRSFGISGEVDEIYPTFDGAMTLTFTNPHRFEIVVTEVEVDLATPAGVCAAALAALPPETPPVFQWGELPAGGVLLSAQQGNTPGSGTAELTLMVTNDLPNQCQTESFEVTFSGTAIRENQP